MDEKSDVRIVIETLEVKEWISYEIESDLLTFADAFNFTIKNPGGKYAGLFKPHQEVFVLVDGTTQMTGYIDTVTYSTNTSGSQISITGRDKFGQLIDNKLTPRQISGKNLEQIAEEISSPWVTEWSLENDTNREKLKTIKSRLAFLLKGGLSKRELDARRYGPVQDDTSNSSPAIKNQRLNLAKIRSIIYPKVKIEPGQSAADILNKYSRRAGLMVWQKADGSGVIAKPNYIQEPTFSIRMRNDYNNQNNSLNCQLSLDGTSRYRSYRALSYSANTKATNGKGSRNDVTVTDTGELLSDRQEVMSLGGGNREQVSESLNRQKQESELSSFTAEYTLIGHKQGDKIYSIDSVFAVDDSITGVLDSLYCVKRRFVGGFEGQTTVVTLKKLGVLLP